MNMQRTIQPTPIQLDSSIAIKMSMRGSMHQEKALMNRADIWHMVKIIRGAQYNREEVLKAILAAVEPSELIPIRYQTTGEDSCFIARNCSQALEKLCRCNLIVKNEDKDPFILLITLGYALIQDLKINIQPHLQMVLCKRHNIDRKYLDLEAFHTDPEVSKLVFCPLTQHRTFNHVLKIAKNLGQWMETINLQKNDLSCLNAIKTSGITNIKRLDLRNNNLLSMDVLTPCKHLAITAIRLDGNPLCENYATVERYVASAKYYLPNLIWLDGVNISSLDLPFTCRNSISDSRKVDLIRKFTQHFFQLYDQIDRSVLRGLYAPDAVYSQSCAIPLQVAQKNGQTAYTIGRNLLKQTKAGHHLYVGQENIISVLKKQPRTDHDVDSFVYDLLYDVGRRIVFNVFGYFKKTSSISSVLSFSRTFILLANQSNEYNILNDQLHIDAAPEGVIFRPKRATGDYVPICFSEQEKREMIKKLGDASTMSESWCKLYLENAKWDLRSALTAFIRDYKSSAVPRKAFLT